MAKNNRNQKNKGNNNQTQKNRNQQVNGTTNQMNPRERLRSFFNKNGDPTLNKTGDPNRQGDIIKVLLDVEIPKNDPSLLIDSADTDDIVRDILDNYSCELSGSDVDEVCKNILEITKDQNMRSMHNVSDDFRTLWGKVYEKYDSLSKDADHPINDIFDEITSNYNDEIAEYDAYIISVYIYVNSALTQLIFPNDQDDDNDVTQAASNRTVIDVEATIVDAVTTIESLSKLAAKELFKNAWSAVRNHLVTTVKDDDLIKAIEVAAEKVISANYSADEIKNCDPLEVLDDMKQSIINEVIAQCLNLTLAADTTDDSDDTDEENKFDALIDKIPGLKNLISEKQFNKISDELKKVNISGMSNAKVTVVLMGIIEKVVGKEKMYDVVKLILNSILVTDDTTDDTSLPAVVPHVRSSYVKNIIDISYEDTIEEFPELKNIFTEDEYYRVIVDVEDAGLVIKTELDVVNNKEKLAEFTKNAIGYRKYAELKRVLEKYGTDVIFTKGLKDKPATKSSATITSIYSRKTDTDLKARIDKFAAGLDRIMGYCDEMRAQATGTSK